MLSEHIHVASTLWNGGTRLRRLSRLRARWSLTAMLVLLASAGAQSHQNPTSPPQRNPASTTYDLNRDTSPPFSGTSTQDGDSFALFPSLNSTPFSPYSNVDTPGALTASQIRKVLQQKPEAIVELKSMLADGMQQQGSQIQANDITDEMLYEQIASSAALREHITSFLLARGYISEDDLQQLVPNIHANGTIAGMNPSGSDQVSSRESARGLSNLPDSETGQLPPGVLLPPGMMSPPWTLGR